MDKNDSKNNKKNLLNGSSLDLYPNISIGKIIFDILKSRNRDEIALTEESTQSHLTFGEILEQSIQCAYALRKLGIQKDDVIMVLSENDIRFPILLLASWYIGAICGPLNPNSAAGEINRYTNLIQPKILFCSTATVKSILPVQKDFPCIENIITFDETSSGLLHFAKLLSGEDGKVAGFVPEKFDAKEQVAMILCSSGTTGLPKGVLLTHENLRVPMNYVKNPDFADINPNDITISALPFFHIFGIMMIFSVLAAGMKLINMKQFQPETFLRTIQEKKINKVFLVPSLAVFLAKHPLVEKYDLSSVKYICCGGAPLAEDVEKILWNKLNLISILKGYGLTECSGLTHLTPRNAEPRFGSSGIPVPLSVCKVVDHASGKSLGSNEAGELCFKGSLVMKGYVDDPESTLQAYDEDGFLHSGDYGYYDEDNYVYIIDRLKDIIKFKGFQVPPAELEGILLKHEAVKEAAVVGKPDERAGELPVAFIVKQPGKDVKEEELVQFVADKISYQKRLHGGIVFVEELPKNATGKIMRRTLRDVIREI